MTTQFCLYPLHTASLYFLFFFFNDTATTEIYTLSLHDALPISNGGTTPDLIELYNYGTSSVDLSGIGLTEDRKSTRLNSSHLVISYAVFCLKKKSLAYLLAIRPHDLLHANAVRRADVAPVRHRV